MLNKKLELEKKLSGKNCCGNICAVFRTYWQVFTNSGEIKVFFLCTKENPKMCTGNNMCIIREKLVILLEGGREFITTKRSASSISSQ